MIHSHGALRSSLALAYLVNMEIQVLQNFREMALKLPTNRDSCRFVRGIIEWTRNNHTWKALPLSLRLRVLIPMSLASRQGTYHGMVGKINEVASTISYSTTRGKKLPPVWFNLRDVTAGVEQVAYREMGIRFCGRIRNYFAGKEGCLDLTFWNQLCELEQSAYQEEVSAKIYREAFTMRYLRLVEIAKAQLSDMSDTEFQTRSKQI
ncbi:hypothetical protein CF95_gp051 [Erwinia phage PhiEaH1]|uniref:Uncharacterized protein n=1 Tax=Erwinia phage PhiEaH1 TaxID=1401669 RepID=W8D0G0_9CAUD|nr:hypothetical protein CF95_gp051 [Erwinia phage PhiEaH1]AGX01773.1 hypothetical protein [Erwinia phage PhiEaH1]